MLGFFNTAWAPTWIIKVEDEFGNQIIKNRFVSMNPAPNASFGPIACRIVCGTEKEGKQYFDKLDEAHYIYLSLQYRYGWSTHTTEKWHLKKTEIENAVLDETILTFDMTYSVIDHKIKEKTEAVKSTKTNRQKRVERMKRMFLK